jgi:hypothetical protein
VVNAIKENNMAKINHTFTVSFQISVESFEHRFPQSQDSEDRLDDSLRKESQEIQERIQDEFNGLEVGEFTIDEVLVVDNE